MIEVVRSFLFDGATFKRTMSDLGAMAAIGSMYPGVPEMIASIGYGSKWVPFLVGLVSFTYSARKRQTQNPPQG